MPWTLNDAIQECARNLFLTTTMTRPVGQNYSTGRSQKYAARLTSGINEAIGKIARERLGLQVTEEATLDDEGKFDLSTLANDPVRVNNVYKDDQEPIYTVRDDDVLWVEGLSDTTVEIVYEYIPAELSETSDLDTQLPINEKYIDPRVLCKFADYKFLSEEGTDYDSARGQVWLNQFNDAFANVRTRVKRRKQVKYNG